MRFLGEFISLSGVFKRPLGMPCCRLGFAFFIVFRGSTVRARRKFVLLGGFSVCLVHVVPLAVRCHFGHWHIRGGFAGR